MWSVVKGNWDKKRLICVVILIAVGLGVTTGGFILFRPDHKPAPLAVNEIKDDTVGLDFKISKNFERIPTLQLQQLNPSFVYGFHPKDVTDTACIVSQTQRSKGGPVPTDVLTQATYEQIKKTKPDAQVLVSEKTHLADGKEAGWLEVSYSEGKSKVKQLEMVATTDMRTTFAFCFSPESLTSVYNDDFRSFLKSIQIN